MHGPPGERTVELRHLFFLPGSMQVDHLRVLMDDPKRGLKYWDIKVAAITDKRKRHWTLLDLIMIGTRPGLSLCRCGQHQ